MTEAKDRLCIFSFYDPGGEVHRYVCYLLQQLDTVCNRIIFIANGFITADGRGMVSWYTDEIYERENVGYDAGAYKYALKNVLKWDVGSYQEIIFCNDTFFGTFKPLKEYFLQMSSVKADFWGFNGFFDVVFSHIQSYFLVFRNGILSEKLLIQYFVESIDGDTTDIYKVYCQFETGLFDFLVRENKKSYAVVAKSSNLDVYWYSFADINKYGLPIVKKKTFTDFESYGDNAWCTLSYIKHCTDYDVSLITEYINKRYDCKIKPSDIGTLDEYDAPKEIHVPVPFYADREIEEKLEDSCFYIYGAGMYAYKTYWRFARKNKGFLGFVISDNSDCKEKTLFGYKVTRFSELNYRNDVKFLLGVGDKNTEEILRFLEKEKKLMMTNIIRIF